MFANVRTLRIVADFRPDRRRLPSGGALPFYASADSVLVFGLPHARRKLPSGGYHPSIWLLRLDLTVRLSPERSEQRHQNPAHPQRPRYRRHRC